MADAAAPGAAAAERRERQEAEVEALEMIFGDDAGVEATLREDGVREVRVGLGGGGAVLEAALPADYPDVAPSLHCIGGTVPEEVLHMCTARATAAAAECAAMGAESLTEAVGAARAVVEDWEAAGGEARGDSVSATDADASGTAGYAGGAGGADTAAPAEEGGAVPKAGAAPAIHAGERITDRKSVFVGYAAAVHSVDDVRAFHTELLQDSRIARATHNMLAYRFTDARGVVVSDNDEDGEHGAGARLSALLEMMEADGVAVVVTRWYGGVHLGPKRFQHISNAARTVLLDSGLVAPRKAR